MRTLLFLLAYVALSASVVTAGTVASVPTGGDWTAPATWVGGKVPAEGDDVIINGTVAAASTTIRSLTISQGATLTGMGGPQYVRITHSLVNNGTVRRNQDNWGLVFEVSGSATNNGVWRPSNLTFVRGTDYSIGGTGRWEGEAIFKSDSMVQLKATSDLNIGCWILMRAPDYKWTELDMQGHSIYLDGSSGVYLAGVLQSAGLRNCASIEMHNNAYVDNVWIHGGTTFKGQALLGSEVHVDGPFVNTDTLSGTGGPKWATFYGSFTNNGVIIPHKDNWHLGLAIKGDVTNNGVWNPITTQLTGTQPQVLRLAAGKWFEGNEFSMPDTLRPIIAGTDLEFRCWVATRAPGYHWGTLDMRGFTLTMDGRRGSDYAGYIDNFVIRNTQRLVMRNGARTSNIHAYGNISFHHKVVIGPNTHMTGTVINIDTLQGFGGPQYLHVYGTFRNQGLVTWHPDRWGFQIAMHGDVYDMGHSVGATYNVLTEGHVRRVGGSFANLLQVNYNTTEESRAGRVDFEGNVRLSDRFDVYNKTTVRIPSSATLTSNAPIVVEWQGALEIHGTIIEERSINNAAHTLSTRTVSGQLPAASGIDSLVVTCRGRQAAATFAPAVHRLWTVAPYPATSTAVFTRLRLLVGDAPMNGNAFGTLQIYHSADNGATWRQITTDVSIRRNEDERWLEMDDAPAYGDFVVSSRPDPTTVQPGILVSILGSDAIRVLAPNRLTIVATNVGPTTTQDFLLPVNVGRQLRLLGAEEVGAAGVRRTMTAADITFENDDSTALFVVAPLEPGEAATLDLILTARSLNGTNKPYDEAQLEPATTIIVGSFVLWVVGKGVEKAVDYLGDKAAEGIELSDAERAKYAQALGVTADQIRISKTKDGWNITAAKEVSSQLMNKMGAGGIAVTTVTAVGENMAKKVAPSMRQRLFNWFYKQTGLIKEDPPAATGPQRTAVGSGIAVKQGRAVTSRDPNEKNGITGSGDRNYISTITPMRYQIRFENEKTAEAPAYQVVITDTLDASVFDTASVRVLRTSHPDARFTRTGNVLRWEWIGIELPPNQTPPEGEGFVEFVVDLKPGLPSGTAIRNRASIVFDLNDPIITNTWTNTLDFEAPRTTGLVVRPIGADSLECTFTATDDGSGISTTSIFASAGQATFGLAGALPGPNIPIRLARPQGALASLRFYALSADNAGNLETVPTGIVGVTTSVNTDAINADDVEVGPLPATSWVTVRSTSGADLGIVTVFDVAGRILVQSRAGAEYRLDVSQWASGLYIVITDRGSVRMQR